jgi:hypothetical protein
MPPPRRHDGHVHNAPKVLTDRSQRRSNIVEGGEDVRGAWLMPRHSRTSWVDRCRRPPRTCPCRPPSSVMVKAASQ